MFTSSGCYSVSATQRMKKKRTTRILARRLGSNPRLPDPPRIPRLLFLLQFRSVLRSPRCPRTPLAPQLRSGSQFLSGSNPTRRRFRSLPAPCTFSRSSHPFPPDCSRMPASETRSKTPPLLSLNPPRSQPHLDRGAVRTLDRRSLSG